jgi:hypothetical protein
MTPPGKHSHVLRARANGEFIANWMEKNAKTQSGQSVAILLARLTRLAEIMQSSKAWRAGLIDATRIREAMEGAELLNEAFNVAAEIRRQQVPSYNAAQSSWELTETHDTAAMRAVLDLLWAGVLDRLRKCKQCCCWFYAHFRHQRYCKPSCQHAFYKSTAEWRSHRRGYMRWYRSVQRRNVK